MQPTEGAGHVGPTLGRGYERPELAVGTEEDISLTSRASRNMLVVDLYGHGAKRSNSNGPNTDANARRDRVGPESHPAPCVTCCVRPRTNPN